MSVGIKYLNNMSEAVQQPSMSGQIGANAIRYLVPTTIEHNTRITAIEDAIERIERAIAHFSEVK